MKINNKGHIFKFLRFSVPRYSGVAVGMFSVFQMRIRLFFCKLYLEHNFQNQNSND